MRLGVVLLLASCATPTYRNPVVAHDCPDPGVLVVDGPAPRFYMACTGGRFRIRASVDLVHWRDTGRFVLPTAKPDWAANGGRDWAPELHLVGDSFVACFTSVDASNRLCIGVAHATAPTGPYTVTDAPLVTDPEGVIDPHLFRDVDGRLWLIYKRDGNAHGHPTPILIRELAPDGLSFAPGSEPVQILVNDPSTWEGGVVEAPWLLRHDGCYYLFYSGNVFDQRYRTGVARSRRLLGPFEKHGAPILANSRTWVGPGHGSVVHTGGDDWFVYHAWRANPDGTPDRARGRQALLDRVTWHDGWPRIGDGTPSDGPRRAPAIAVR